MATKKTSASIWWLHTDRDWRIGGIGLKHASKTHNQTQDADTGLHLHAASQSVSPSVTSETDHSSSSSSSNDKSSLNHSVYLMQRPHSPWYPRASTVVVGGSRRWNLSAVVTHSSYLQNVLLQANLQVSAIYLDENGHGNKTETKR